MPSQLGPSERGATNLKNLEVSIMHVRHFPRAAIVVAALVLAIGLVALAQDPPTPKHFSGTISDYTPQTGVSGPWEMRGTWSLDLKHDAHAADFSVALNMTHDDYWVSIQTTPSTVVNDDTAAGRHPHTHHISIADGAVSWISDNEFTVTGGVTVTLDGGVTPFAAACEFTPPNPPPCTLTVDVKGGTLVQFSNITMTFSGAPTGHFGPQAIHGVVRLPKKPDSDDHDQDHDHY
jgi:hypothetical protein